MIIHSTHNDASLRIECGRNVDVMDFSVMATLGYDTVENGGIFLIQEHQFLRALQDFERKRSGEAVLTGSENFQLTIKSDGQMGHAWLSFNVSRALYSRSPQTGNVRSGCISMTGGFPIPGNSLGQITRDFAELFETVRGRK